MYFSQGNLQYIGSASTPYWKFANHQWDYLGDNGQGSTSQNVDRDLFGWGTSGYNHGANCYQPWSTGSGYSSYYAYGNANYNLYDQTGQADWGYNAISNGGNQVGLWRTMTFNEWKFVFINRNTPSGIRYVKATVNNVNGVILVPDDWSISTYNLNSTNNSEASFSSNTISQSVWEVILESAGCVFMPAAGYRFGISVDGLEDSGYYWSSSYYQNEYACDVFLCDGDFTTTGFFRRDGGLSVRLVRGRE